MNKLTPTHWIALVEHLYGALLILYPAEYRREYGVLMQQVFRDVCRDKLRRAGVMGVFLWWCTTLLDLTVTVIEERRKVRFIMSKSMFIQLAGGLLVVGGFLGMIAAFSQFQGDDHSTYYGIYQILILALAPSTLLIGLGLIGLGMGYGAGTGKVGQWALYTGGVSSMAMAIAVVLTSIDDQFWVTWFVSGAIHLAAVVVFGLAYARKPVLPIFRLLPLMLSSGWVIMGTGIPDRFPLATRNALSFLMLFGVSLGWFAIGMVVHRMQRSEKQSLPLAPST